MLLRRLRSFLWGWCRMNDSDIMLALSILAIAVFAIRLVFRLVYRRGTTFRITSKEFKERLDRLTGPGTHEKTIRNALQVYEYLAEEVKSGSRFFIKQHGEDLAPVQFFEEHKEDCNCPECNPF